MNIIADSWILVTSFIKSFVPKIIINSKDSMEKIWKEAGRKIN
jgi:hypothetical protein